jgi:7-carboxy-7-deazaguanine synthase
MTYTVKEIFLTQQGEGANIGKTAVFIRFAGCNLWSGREADRARAVCKFCDTDFVGGTRYSAAEMADLAVALWPGEWRRFCVLTGGEPLLQVDAALVKELRSRRFSVAIETNGTRPLPCNVDWVCVSPKAGVPLVLRDADELKLVYPQAGISPDDLTEFSAVHRWLSPMDAPRRKQAAAIYCRAHLILNGGSRSRHIKPGTSHEVHARLRDRLEAGSDYAARRNGRQAPLSAPAWSRSSMPLTTIGGSARG